ncbi:tyrosine-type recombinase/integrase [Nitrosomonas ureae]|uniref:Site-specific recombinase XerD n=1 Tax=Nitrosomonas ureae TaxID=44577 RepID=A0A286A733_9PROT|nr:site-specific integrase [Nitrosomonas ureae]SOD17720.1 Site-specific recombinase XerD [Nitrosomonas ureae]
MKTKKTQVAEMKQTILDSYISKVTPDAILEIKENSKGRGQGVFVTRVLINGNVDFYFRYFFNEKEKSKKIGRYGKTSGNLTLAKAKAKFRELSTIYQSGIDPKAQAQEIAQKLENEKKTQNEIERKKQMQGTFGQLSEYYLAHLKQNRGEKHYKNVRNAFEKDLHIIAPDTKASDIKKEDILKILHVITQRNALVMANRMRSYLSAMFAYGMVFDDSTESITKHTQFFIQSNPVSKVQKIIKNEKRGDRSLSEDEVRIFWRALDKSKMSVLKINAFKLILLSGARVNEIAALEWNEIDLPMMTITLPSERTKNKRQHIIPINDSMVKIINMNPKLHDTYLFPASNNEPQKVDGFSQAISRLLKNIEIDPFTPRDLRRTFKTLTGKAGISKEIRDRLQNHSLNDVSSLHYDKYDYLKEKRDAMNEWNDYFLEIINLDVYGNEF